jgi:simple sugar transport system substrate-binding protein
MGCALVACGDDAGGGDQVDLIKVGFAQLGDSSTWRVANTASVQAALSFENGFVLTYGGVENTQATQIQALRNFVKQKVDIIILAPLVETGWDEVLQEVKEAGIPVLLVEGTLTTAVTGAYVAWIGADFTNQGEIAGGWVKEYYPGAKIFELRGLPGSPAQVERDRGFEAMVGEETILGTGVGNFIGIEAKTVIEKALIDYPELNLIFSHNDAMALGAAKAIEEAGKIPGQDIIIVTVDGSKAGLQALVDGKFNFIVEHTPLFGPQNRRPNPQDPRRRTRTPIHPSLLPNLRPNHHPNRSRRPRLLDDGSPRAGQLEVLGRSNLSKIQSK